MAQLVELYTGNRRVASLGLAANVTPTFLLSIVNHCYLTSEIIHFVVEG